MSDNLLYEYYSKNSDIIAKSSIGTPCLICGETVVIQYYCDVPKICDKCKAAVMVMREQMDRERREDG